MEIVYKEESYRIMGACFEVYKEMGCGFVEPVYQECLEMELGIQNIAYRPQAELSLCYKSRPLKCKYIPDFLLFDKIVLEIKAVKELAAEHHAQVHNYLKGNRFPPRPSGQLWLLSEGRIRANCHLIFFV